ncbi:hypothetical protein F4779DRAFT_588689 [Xylariaceae sp. FL0662B]|nr:hypothetical protein F4779DRAFT_588689 [Xylariaceae sp. FL0662B]
MSNYIVTTPPPPPPPPRLFYPGGVNGTCWFLASKYYPDHPLMNRFNDACIKGTLDDVRGLMIRGQNTPQPALSRRPNHYPIDTSESTLYHDIRADHVDIEAYFLDQGIRMNGLEAGEAVRLKSFPSV